MTFVGLTWDHPRGYDALAEAARRANDGCPEPLIEWKKQPLEGFESAPIADLAAAHDLLVLDHPHIGEAVAENCLIPLEELYPARTIQAWRDNAVGSSFRSYGFNGRSWALPLDVACQVVARRPDRIADAPTDWAQVEDMAKAHNVALSLAGPHAILMLMSMAAGDAAYAGGETFLADDAAETALARMHRLYRLRPAGSETLNPIALLEAMAASDDIAMIPLIFGYVTYARAGYAPNVLAFSDSIGSAAGGALGGTGIGFSRRTKPSAALLDHVAALMEPGTQAGLFPEFGGQPSARSAWQDTSVNHAWGDFYAHTLRSAERAFLRPRFDGYIAFQSAASERLRAALDTREPEPRTLNALRRLWTDARRAARGNLDDDRGQS